MIRSTRALALVTALTVVVGLIVLFPARIAYQWASPPQLTMSGIHGTVWRGRADAVSAAGIFLQNVSWRAKPLRLLTGQAAYSIEGSPVTGFVEGNIGIGIGGTLSVSDLTASIPLQIFAESLNIRGLQGQASLEFDRVKIRDGIPLAVDGTAEVSNLVAPAISRDSIGGFRAEFFTQNNGVVASVEDTDGVLDLAGSLQLNDDGSYEFLGQVVAKPNAPANLRQQLQYLGSANERGQRELRLEGNLQ